MEVEKRGRGRPRGSTGAYTHGNSPFFHPLAKTRLRSRQNGKLYTVVRTIKDEVDYRVEGDDTVHTVRDISWRRKCVKLQMVVEFVPEGAVR
jgi:hypothetical protein